MSKSLVICCTYVHARPPPWVWPDEKAHRRRSEVEAHLGAPSGTSNALDLILLHAPYQARAALLASVGRFSPLKGSLDMASASNVPLIRQPLNAVQLFPLGTTARAPATQRVTSGKYLRRIEAHLSWPPKTRT